MAQFRITAKMAKELKVNELQLPLEATRLYDDWYLDIARILRKKIFIFMHIQSKIALAIPGYEIGGTQNLFNFFPILFKEFLDVLDYDNIADEVYHFFICPKERMHFVKTNDKSTLRYVSDFKLLLEIETKKYSDITQPLCDKVSTKWLKHLISNKLELGKYTTPLKLWQNLFKY